MVVESECLQFPIVKYTSLIGLISLPTVIIVAVVVVVASSNNSTIFLLERM
jgi:hypothetical protein